MRAEPPNRDLDSAIAAAISAPKSANLYQLLDELERSLLDLSEESQLQVAGDVLARLADVCACRASLLLEEWEETYNPHQSEPILTAEHLQEVLRHSMALNLDGLLESYPSQPSLYQPSEVVIGAVEKATLLEFIAQLDHESAKQNALNIAHQEDISTWTQAIAGAMQQWPQGVSLLNLQEILQVPLVEVWLGLLLGGYSMAQEGEFYDPEGIWISAPS